MDNSPVDSPASKSPSIARAQGRRGIRLAHWGKEFITVFVGVYAAFALNSYQAHRQERQRRAQILEWALREYSETETFVTNEAELLRAGAEKFNGRVKAGEMPVLHPFNFRSDYDPTDFTSMLQSGGFDLLEVATVRDIRAVEGSLRQMIDVIHHDQQLSDVLILPHLDEQPGVFYNLETKQLRPTYAWYPDYMKTQLEIFGQMHTDLVTVLAQLRAEQSRNR